jgi:hypothetical protein
MMLDASLTFVPAGVPASMVVGGVATTQLGQWIDLLGQGVGTAPMNIIGNTTVFGEDVGIGIWKLDLQINNGTAPLGGDNNFALQGAIDTGLSGGYQPGTPETFAETGSKTPAQLPANSVLRMAMPPTPPDMPTPRFIRLVSVSSAAVTAGTVAAAFMVQGRDDLQNRFAANNYVVR